MVNRLGQGICYSLLEEMEILVGDVVFPLHLNQIVIN